MHWLYLLFALVALVVAMKTASSAVMLLCLLVSLAMLVLWLIGLYSTRVAGRSRDPSAMIDPAELRRLREQAEARKAANGPESPSP
jgi:hypothetical protein